MSSSVGVSPIFFDDSDHRRDALLREVRLKNSLDIPVGYQFSLGYTEPPAPAKEAPPNRILLPAIIMSQIW